MRLVSRRWEGLAGMPDNQPDDRVRLRREPLSADGHGRLARGATGAALLMIAVGCLPAVARADGAIPAGLHDSLPRPVAHRDAADVPSPLDVAAAAFGQTGQTFVLRIQVRGPLPSKALAAGNGRSLCLVVEQRRPVRDQRLCLAVSRTGRLGLVESHRGADGVYVAPHAIAAHVRRTAADTLLATFTPAAARLTHGRVVWHMSSEWADDAACPAPAAGAVAVCTDRVPDRGGFAVRVHRGYVVGCVPAGASQRKVGPRRPRRVALTFDDGPGPQTGAILRILQRAHIHATFFELGVQVRLYPALVRRTLAEGHSIGNHTWDHRPMTSLSSATADSELSRTSAVIRRASRFATCLFRPPGGAIDAAVAAAARHRQMLSVLWDVDPRDWATPGADAIVANVLGHAHAGSIILLHDAGGPRGETVAALPRIIAGLRARNLAFVTVPALLGLAPRIAWD